MTVELAKQTKFFYQWLMLAAQAAAKVQSSLYIGKKQGKQNARQGAKMELQINVENK